MEYINKKIGERIKEARLEKKLSREQVARRLGITQQTIEKYEKGEIDISVRRLIQISNILNVAITYFLIREGEDYTIFNHYVALQTKSNINT